MSKLDALMLSGTVEPWDPFDEDANREGEPDGWEPAPDPVCEFCGDLLTRCEHGRSDYEPAW